MSQPLRVVVVDDSALYRQTIRNVLRDIANVEVVGAAKDGPSALQMVKTLDPDVVTLDYEMPEMDGIQVLRRMKRLRRRAQVIMVSSYTEEGAKVTTDALLEGAFDFIQKPSKGTPEENRRQLHAALIEKMLAIAESQGQSVSVAASEAAKRVLHVPNACEAVFVGASTGGPVALRQVLSELPGDLPVPVIVVQHMPQQFTAPLAKRLDDACQLEVVETRDGQRVRAGGVYIAAGGKHTRLSRRGSHVIARLCDDPPENSCRPSVDYTLRAAIRVYEGRVLGVILTGMGKDGLIGCQELKAIGGHVFAQHPDGCVVYGMPKAVIEAGLADRIEPIEKVACAIRQFLLSKPDDL